MNSVQLFTCQCYEAEELSVLQSVVRILLACMKCTVHDVREIKISLYLSLFLCLSLFLSLCSIMLWLALGYLVLYKLVAWIITIFILF